jgi:thiamine biosynthesis lipoprotein
MTVAMDTEVHLQLVADQAADVHAALDRALAWFGAVEQACSRFDPNSELRRLLDRPGEPVAVSPALFEATRFAVQLARATHGAFDPTVGRRLEQSGFNRHYATGEVVDSPQTDPKVSYRDIRLGRRGTITLRRRLVLDLGAVAKGLAIDLAARELHGFGGLCVEAGGDLFVSGRNADGEAWRIGVQDPRAPDRLATTLTVTDTAVCTSGDYLRRQPDGLGHHLLDPRTGQSAAGLASVTVLAPTAMAADGLSTAAFVLGREAGARLLSQSRVAGILMTPHGDVVYIDPERKLQAHD